jgi:hypothetical protein
MAQWYPQRDAHGAIVGLCNLPQYQPDGSCLTDTTPLPDTDPAIVAFLAAQAAAQTPKP